MTPENEANFDELVKALATAAGIDDMAKEDGRVLFAIDDDMGVSIAPADAEEAGGDLAVVAIIVGPAPEDPEMLTYLLEQNYLGVGAGDGSFSIEREMGALVLYRAFELPMDPGVFTDAFGRLAGAARAARAHLAGVAEPAESALGGFNGISV